MNPAMKSPRLIIPLNGVWQLQPGNDEIIPSTWAHTAPVPSLVDTAVPPVDWRQYKYHWHKTSFEIPEPSALADLAFIVIEQAMFGTDVWLNGKHLGGDIACYTSQEYDAREAIRTGANELIVRVGRREDLPPHSAAGNDQERAEWIPGIWGDVYVLQCGNPRVRRVQVIPHIDPARAEVRVSVQNLSPAKQSVAITSRILEKASRRPASGNIERKLSLGGNSTHVETFNHGIDGAHFWSPDSPFLYEAETRLCCEETLSDLHLAAFGMREFTISGAGFLLNGKRIFLRGGNIAFHRFLSDPERGVLPWNPEWIRKALIDIPKAHNFNFFRNHIGQMYNRWYDIADEFGMLLQNEWMFWTTSGSKEQIRDEFTRWLQDNWNHPSIIIWDALNECSDATVQNDIVPQMKKLDPTRPWESVDFVEQHPYIYSLCPVLNDRRMGFADSLEAIEHSAAPSVVNEFLWWWIDRKGEPTVLTREVVERWLGKDWTPGELAERQTFLAQELVELFRRMRVDAIQPFVYLSNDSGPTANWFAGRMADPTPKPILKTLKNAFAPFGISLELWDRHFFTNERRRVRLFAFNDSAENTSGSVRYGVTDPEGEWLSEERIGFALEASGSAVMPLTFLMPPDPGEFRIRAELMPRGGSSGGCISQKIAHVFEPVNRSSGMRATSIAAIGGEELATYLKGQGFAVGEWTEQGLNPARVIYAGEGTITSDKYQSQIHGLSARVRDGATLVLIEPEFGIEGVKEVRALEDMTLTIQHRADPDRGGYDSYIFPEDLKHPLWKGIKKEHLHMFNGGFGGEVISQHNVSISVPATVFARCGLKLGVSAVVEIPYEKGRVIVSRLQLRGRLVKQDVEDSLYERRVDPVLQRYLLNLISYAS